MREGLNTMEINRQDQDTMEELLFALLESRHQRGVVIWWRDLG